MNNAIEIIAATFVAHLYRVVTCAIDNDRTGPAAQTAIRGLSNSLIRNDWDLNDAVDSLVQLMAIHGVESHADARRWTRRGFRDLDECVELLASVVDFELGIDERALAYQIKLEMVGGDAAAQVRRAAAAADLEDRQGSFF